MFSNNLGFSIFTTFFIGVAKEMSDDYLYNKFDYKDIIANVLGILLGLIYILNPLNL